MQDVRFLTLKQAAQLLNINERTMKRLLIKNKDVLSFQRLDGRYMIEKAELLNLIKSKLFTY